ncbi:acetyl-CoA hydrolase/transferase family protein [Clostridiales bacterium TF09-2AC]|uniref:Acetyl-CoA hydrolase/transferase C-terminal domain-containing protein n=1 Tax=Enterocloster hominis (ex Hitch et al. 2024) TaxID=1917870 RepID=A0ABV1DFV2_9FIRM|nr:acetyl-CoA hydrolase/transferase C-terminal domain-containing protein [Lachnoclostridium pacaense]MCC2820431.1 acetyl-CoA hydrolase/transferase family protein [Lachnoclostridium pacaense]RJW33877.1 acetyl-CoA hydrolase/transferase family protein [Clostridiales bacterium TF09-2AC]
MSWKEKYADKIYTAAEAVSHVKSGEKIIFGDWVSEPPALVEALVNRADELKGVEIIHGMSPGPNAYVAPEYEGIFHHTSLFIGPKTRKAYAEKRIDYIGGTTFSRWPDLFAKNPDLNPHWAFIQVSEPDEEGMCSFGNACCFSEPAARTADRIIAQINPKMPTLGGKKISLDKIDYIVPAESGLYTIGRAEIDAKTQTIADYVAELVEDGATIQLGIGALPDAIARNLMGKKDLGVHSETLTEAMMELVQAGVINNSKKTLNPGICIGAQAAGSEKFYEFIDHHPLFAVYPVDYVNDPYVVGQNYKQTSINSCMEVDLKGQVNSETVGGRQYSGIGGQLDHVRGAQLSEGGKSILALNSTARQDTISKIVPYFAPGNVTTISRYDVHYIVTEYGVADLKYKTERQRALALISIAHPKFRDELKFKAAEMGIL